VSSYSSIDRALELFVAPFDDEKRDWDDVLRRADEPGHHPHRVAGRMRPRGSSRRRIVLFALVAVAAVAIPLLAVAASKDWWFLAHGALPKPTSSPVVIKVERWGASEWQVVAYPSETDGICFGITPIRGSVAAVMGCAPLRGIARTSHTKPTPDLTITFLASFNTSGISYIVGPVVATATHVEVVLRDGQHVHLPTFSAPPPLTNVRFYASQIRMPRQRPVVRSRPPIAKLIGLDRHGKVVACLVPAHDGNKPEPLSDCR
jgi:hypothetical protein